MRRLIVALLVVAIVGVGRPAGAGQAADLTVEQVLSYAFPTSLTAAPDGSAIAWVLDERGARNVWVATAPEFPGRRLTSHRSDDGQAIGDLQFSSDSAHLVWVRGGAPNRSGELPNPSSIATGVERQIFAAAVAGGEPWLVATGSAPVVSPTDAAIVFRGTQGLMHLPIARPSGAGEREARLVAAPRGGTTGVRWSPDGSRLLFLSNRSTHALVGVVGLDGGSITWIDPSVDRDSSAVWSRDGSRVAFVRTPARATSQRFGPRREGRPWSIHVAEVGDESSRVVFSAAPGFGSVPREIDVTSGPHAAGGLVWAAGDRLVFPWERDGWTGLYGVEASGGEASPLLTGPFEVEAVSTNAASTQLLVTSNQSDIDRRAVARLAVDADAEPLALGTAGWIQWSPVSVAGRGVAYLRSNGTTPAHAVFRPDDGAPRALAPGAIPADYPSGQMIEPRPVRVSGADGLRVHAQLFEPRGEPPDGGYPAVIFFHGGSRRQMLLGFHYLAYYHHAYALNQLLASRGYVVLSVNYRSGIGYGLEFREALAYGATGASEFNDVLGAGLYLRSREDVDPARIGLWGGSYGGYLTAMGLARASDLFAAGVDIHGVHDWNEGIRIFDPDYAPTPEQARLAFESSPNASLDTWRSPVLLIHGDDDRNVFFSQTVYLVEALRDRDVHVEQLVFPDEVHGFLLHRNWVRAFEAAVEFFDGQLE